MSVKCSAAVRNARLEAIESTIGTSPILRIRTGAAPASIADADSGTVLAEMTLPSDWMSAAVSGVKSKSGVWKDASANASGTAGHFRLYASDGTTVHMQGACTDGAGAGPMKLNNTSIAETQPVTVTAFTLTEGNA